MNLVCVSVCLSTFFSATKSPSFMKFWLKVSFGPVLLKNGFYVQNKVFFVPWKIFEKSLLKILERCLFSHVTVEGAPLLAEAPSAPPLRFARIKVSAAHCPPRKKRELREFDFFWICWNLTHRRMKSFFETKKITVEALSPKGLSVRQTVSGDSWTHLTDYHR